MPWTTVPNAALLIDKPWTSALAFAVRDNPIAIAAGDPGAPRIVPGALDRAYIRQGQGLGMLGNNVFVGWNGSQIILQIDSTPLGTIHYSGLARGDIGSYAFCSVRPVSDIGTLNVSGGANVAGSSLFYALVDAIGPIGDAPALSGTWRNMGLDVANEQATLFMRVA